MTVPVLKTHTVVSPGIAAQIKAKSSKLVNVSEELKPGWKL